MPQLVEAEDGVWGCSRGRKPELRTEGKSPLCCRMRAGRTPGALCEESLYSLQEAPVGHLTSPLHQGPGTRQLGSHWHLIPRNAHTLQHLCWG